MLSLSKHLVFSIQNFYCKRKKIIARTAILGLNQE